MKVSKKKLLGFSGLALVAGLTTYAATIPVGATSVSGEVNVMVDVYSINYETRIDSPLDGATFDQPVVDFEERHSRVDSVKYYLTNVTTGTTYELSQYEISGTDVSGVTTFTLDLDNYGGYGEYIFRSVVLSYGSHLEGEDSVQFTYVSPDSPNVPDTGGSGLGAFYESLNISKSDLITTGLIAFLAVSLLSLYVIRKSKREE